MEFQKNQVYEITIEDIGAEGEGIGKVDGFPLFVKDAVAGDAVRVKITKAKKNYAFARLEEILTPSPDRVTPPCPFHRQCGGCQIQALSYPVQLQFKERKLRNDLLRIGGFTKELLDQVTGQVIGMEEPWHYRNKAQYPFGLSEDNTPITGFYAGRTHHIIANTDCLLGAPENQVVLQKVLAFIQNAGISIYDENENTGLLRHVLIRKSRSEGTLMVCLIINGKKLPQQEILIQELTQIPGITSISINHNREKTNAIMGSQTKTIWGEDTIRDTLRLWEKNKEPLQEDTEYHLTDLSVSYRISPNSFYQVNPEQAERLYSLVLEYAGLTGKETVWDLYCGIGTISLFLAQRAKKVYGVEIVPQAIEDARQNALDNQISNAEFYVGKAEEVLPAWHEKTAEHTDVIVVDPPRKGCDETCLETMLRMQPDKIIYVSCDPATLARDLKILCRHSYQLEKVRPVDLFGQTVHVETVCLLQKKNI